MATCQNCGRHVSERYVRVFAPHDVEASGEVRVCPNCPDKVRDGGQIRESRSARRVDQNHER